MLKLHKVRKEFETEDSAVMAVDDVSLSVDNNEFIGIVGHSGSGKSTLLNMMAGLLTPTVGEILFHDDDINKMNDKQISELRNKKIGYILQGQTLMPNLTVYENIILPLTFNHEKICKTDVFSLMSDIGIDAIANKYPSEISGGEAKRCAIARALILKPELLLADEPVSDLDPDNVDIIISIFKKYAKNDMSIIMVTHNMNTIDDCDVVYEMHNGKLKNSNCKPKKKK